LLLLFGVDIPIGAEDYVGKNGYYTFQISVNCWNNLYNGGSLNIPTTQAQLNLIFIYDGWMRIQNGTVTFDVGLPPTLTPPPQITPQEVAAEAAAAAKQAVQEALQSLKTSS
jgi:hypothetical protein